MGVFPIGDQRVGVEFASPVLDEDDNPVYTEYGEPVVETRIVWVDNACFEIQTPTEQQNMTVTTSEIAWALLPVNSDGQIPAVDDDGEPAPVDFFDEDGNVTISSALWLHHNGLRYAMRSDAVLEQDIRGRNDHVFCICERETT